MEVVSSLIGSCFWHFWIKLRKISFSKRALFNEASDPRTLHLSKTGPTWQISFSVSPNKKLIKFFKALRKPIFTLYRVLFFYPKRTNSKLHSKFELPQILELTLSDHWSRKNPGVFKWVTYMDTIRRIGPNPQSYAPTMKNAILNPP